MPEILMEPPEALRPYARMVQAGDLPLHCYLAGPADAPPLLLVHGLGDEADTWRRVLPALAERYRVIAPDLPGFGRSAKPTRAYTTTFFARTLVNLLHALNIPRVTLVGHSGGAMVAQRLALARPQLVERLLLLAGCLPVVSDLPAPALLTFLTPGVGELAYTSLRRSQELAYETLRPYYADLDGLPAEERDFLRRRVWARVWSNGQRRAFLSVLRWLSFDAAAHARTYRLGIARSPVPTRLIWGDQDRIVARHFGERVAALIPGAHIETVAACGHLPQQEQPAALLALIG